MSQRNGLSGITNIGPSSVSPHRDEDYVLDLSSLLAIIEAVRCQPHMVGIRLGQAVADLTARRACLCLHPPSQPCPEPYETGSHRVRIQYAGYIYGTLYVALDPHTHRPSLRDPVVEHVATTCGIVLNAVEREVFVRFQAHRAQYACLERLTVREREVLVLIGQGATPREIAQLLQISPNTVATYRRQIYDKWDVNSALSAVLTGQKAGLFLYLTQTP